MAATVATAVEVGELTDERLVAHAQAGDDRAVAELLRRHRGLARTHARSYYLVGGERDDTLQEAMVGLLEAVRDYSPAHGTSFRTFAELCIRRQILSAVRSATRHKHAPLNTYVSFDRPVDDDRGILAETLPADGGDPLDELVASDGLRRLRAASAEVLSGLEADVLALHADGRSYREIAAALDRRVRSVDNALQRVKRKLGPHLRDAAEAC